MKRSFLFAATTTVLLAIGCTMAPKYARPEAPVPPSWPTGPAYAPTGPELASTVNWQEFFKDEKLREIIAMALANNRDLRVAALNVDRARALYGIARAELLPRVDANAAGSRQRVPADILRADDPRTYSQYGVNLGVASWELDFFGRIQSLKDRALMEYLATEQARRSAQIVLVAAVADAYFALAADRENLRLSETTLQTQQAGYDLIKHRYALGLAPELDVFQAQAPLEVARRDLAIYTRNIARDENALNLLVGVPTSVQGLPADLNSVVAPGEIGPGVSSEVLLRRPDVIQSEDLLQAANADIGAARAAFFPRIALTAAIGTASSDLSGLFQAGSGAWSYAPQIVMPIFDARTWSAHRAAKVQREIAVAQYERAVQSAFRDVADALAALGTIDRQVAAQEALVRASAEAHRLANSRYERGIDNYLTVLDAQRTLFAAQQVLVFLRLEKVSSQVRLYAALGGGWQETSATPVAMTSIPKAAVQR